MAVLDLMAIAFATGIGAGIATPIGNWIYKKFVEQSLDRAHGKVTELGTKEYYDKKFQETADQIKRLEITEEKLARFLNIEQTQKQKGQEEERSR